VLGPVGGPGMISFRLDAVCAEVGASYAPDKLDPGAIGMEKPEGEGTGNECTGALWGIKKIGMLCEVRTIILHSPLRVGDQGMLQHSRNEAFLSF
jgi:hypothetical protein